MTAALRYHQATCVTAGGSDEVAASARGRRPEPVKTYGAATAVPAMASAVGKLLDAASGVTKVRTYAGAGTFYFRRYSSAGGLYPLETYVVSAGRLHAFDPLCHGLVPLAPAAPDDLADAAAAPALAHAGATIIVTGLLARTAWKYGERGYRHVWWDAGTLLANVLTLAAARSLRPRLYVAFADQQLDLLLGIDGTNEFTAALVSLDVPPLPNDVVGSPRPAAGHDAGLRYPLAEDLHAASSLADRADVRRWRAGSGADEPVLEAAAVERAVAARRSVRRYQNAPLDRAVLDDLLAWGQGPIPADAPAVVQQRAAVVQVAGLQPGIYDSELRRVAPCPADELRRAIGFAAMNQDHPHYAAVNVGQTADLGAVVEVLGDRGYRWAHIEAGIRAGRLQLGAARHGWGAAAATFYDDELARVLGTVDAPLLLVSLGRPGTRRTEPGGLRSRPSEGPAETAGPDHPRLPEARTFHGK